MEKIRGVVYKMDNPVQATERFTYRNFIIQEDLLTKTGPYTSWYPIQASNNRLSLLDGISPGMEVEVTVAINGKKYNRKDTGEEGFFVSLTLMKLDRVNTFTPQGQTVYSQPVVGIGGIIEIDEPKENDLPF